MPRTKPTRNFLGTILKRSIVKDGKKITVYDARKRYPALDADGNPKKNAKGKIIYKDKTQRCYSMPEAQVALVNLQTQIQDEQKSEAEKEQKKEVHTLFEIVDHFKKTYVKPAVYSGNRKIGYKQDLKTIDRHLEEIKKYFGDVDLKILTYEHCKLFADHLASTPTKKGTLPAPSTYHKKLTFLNRILNIAVQKEWLGTNPMSRGDALIVRAAEAERNRMLTYEEEARLLAVCESDTIEVNFKRRIDVPDYTNKNGKVVRLNWKKEEFPIQAPTNRPHLKIFILLSLDTGMRLGEVQNLKWWQVDFANRVIYLTEEAAEQTKTGVPGILPLIPRLAEELRKVKENSPNAGPLDLVVGKMNVGKSFRSACRAAGITGLQFRDLRATGATRMLLAGNAGDLVKKVTRHTNTDIFLNHYTQVDKRNAQLIGEKLQRFNDKERKKITGEKPAKIRAKVKAKGEGRKKASA